MKDAFNLDTPLRLGRLASNPAEVDNGAIFFNTTSDRFKLYQRSGWRDLADQEWVQDEIAGSSSGLAIANDWAPATEYGLYQIAVNPEGVTYRASEAHLSSASFLTDLNKWEAIGVSNGAVVSNDIAFTPEIDGISIGDGTMTGVYRRVGEYMEGKVSVHLGTTGSITGGLVFYTPGYVNVASTASNLGVRYPRGKLYAVTGSTWIYGAPYSQVGTYYSYTLPLGIYSDTGNYETLNIMSTTNPAPSGPVGVIEFDFNFPVTEWAGSGVTNFNANAIKQTKWVDIVPSESGFAPTRAKARFSADSNDVWVMEYQIVGTYGSIDYGNLSIANIPNFAAATAATVTDQGNNNWARGYCNNGASTIGWTSGTPLTQLEITGRVELVSEPTYFTATDLESNPAVAVERANETTDGVLAYEAQTIGGAKTFVDSVQINADLAITNDVSIGTSRTSVTPAQYNEISFPRGGIFYSVTNVQNQLFMLSNMYFDAVGGFRYINDGPGTYMAIDNGTFTFGRGVSGLAGDPMTQLPTMGIDASGGVGVGGSSGIGSGYVFKVTGNMWATGGGIKFDGLSDGSLTLVSGSLSSSSDSRLKTELAGSYGLETVLQLKPKAFEWKDTLKKDYGFFAQEVGEAIPEALGDQGNDGFYNFFDRPVIAALTKAVQEQQAIIEDLKSRIEVLEA